MEVQLTPEELEQVITFAKQIRQKQSKEGSRDTRNEDFGDKRLENEIIGKVGEVAVANYVKGQVDFRVWPTGTRGYSQFEPDISNATKEEFKGFHIHVKTCHWKYIRGNKSWTVDKNDPIILRPKPTDLIFLVFALPEGKARIDGYVRATDVQGLWKPCFSEFMRHKLAIYYEDIQRLILRVFL